jgi:hypothetical protein
MSDGAMALLLMFIVGLVIGSAGAFWLFWLRVLPHFKGYVDTRWDTLNLKVDRHYDAYMSSDRCVLHDLEREANR